MKPSDPSSDDPQDAEWRHLRRANRRRLVGYSLLIVLAIVAVVLADVVPGKGR